MKTIKNERGQELHQTCHKILEARKQMNKWEQKNLNKAEIQACGLRSQ